MENSESKIERVEQKTQQRPRELGDQQRSEEKARELIGARDREKTLSKEAQQHSDSGSIRNKSEYIPDGDETARLCEARDISKDWINHHKDAPKQELEKKRKDISKIEELVAKTPVKHCPENDL